jgi:hypothetical protein
LSGNGTAVADLDEGLRRDRHDAGVRGQRPRRDRSPPLLVIRIADGVPGVCITHSSVPVGLVKSVRLRCLRILVDQSAENRTPVNPGGVQVYDVRRRIRPLLAQRTMWTVAVVVGHVLGEDRRQMTLADDEHPVSAFAADSAHPAPRRMSSPGVPAAES